MMRRQIAVTLLTLGAVLTVISCSSEPKETSSIAAAKPGEAAVSSRSPALQAPPSSDPRFLAADLPLLPVGVDRAVFPLPVMRATYEFAARHPEVMRYMPCFCGCERGGHQDNHDCFVTSRGADDKVTGWETHAIGCEICVSVAQQALQMHNSGASVSAIRDAIEKKYAGLVAERGNHTPTPMPKRGGESHH